MSQLHFEPPSCQHLQHNRWYLRELVSRHEVGQNKHLLVQKNGLADKRPQREEAGLGVLALSLASEKFQVLCTTASQNLCVFSTFISDGCHQEETGDCW